MSDQNEKRPDGPTECRDAGGNLAPEGSRRALIKNLGLAAAVAPAMVVLLKGESKATPDCDNPAWQLGLKRAGHSGC